MESVDYWIGILNWMGSLMFFVGGMEGFIGHHLTTTGKVMLTTFTWLLGSVLFSVNGLLLYLEMLNPAW